MKLTPDTLKRAVKQKSEEREVRGSGILCEPSRIHQSSTPSRVPFESKNHTLETFKRRSPVSYAF